MHHIKTAKILFFMAVLVLVAKPFLGFSMFYRLQHASHKNIYVKAFTKRKQEYAEDSVFNVASIQKKLAEPLNALLLHFSSLLAIVLPALFALRTRITHSLLAQLQLSLSPRAHTYLLNSSLII